MEHEHDGCERGRLAAIVARADWAPMPAPATASRFEQIAETLLMMAQVFDKRITALEQGTAIRRDVMTRGKTLADIERQAIIDALQASRGLRNKAAAMLGITPRVMSYKVQLLGLQQFCALTIQQRRGDAKRAAEAAEGLVMAPNQRLITVDSAA